MAVVAREEEGLAAEEVQEEGVMAVGGLAGKEMGVEEWEVGGMAGEVMEGTAGAAGAAQAVVRVVGWDQGDLGGLEEERGWEEAGWVGSGWEEEARAEVREGWVKVVLAVEWEGRGWEEAGSGWAVQEAWVAQGWVVAVLEEA